MSRLEELLRTLCPNGVQFETLDEIAVRTKGTPITAAQMKGLDKPNAPVKIFAGGKTVAYFDYADLPKKDVNTYPSVIVKSRGVIEFEYYDKPFSHKNEMWSYHIERDDVDIMFLYYFLKTQEGKLREKAASMGAFPQIAIPDTEKLLIPLPPLPVQEEIVRILDTFTALETELEKQLEAELSARTQQYDHYRNALFEENQRSEKKTLGDIGKVCMCRRIYKEQTNSSGDVPFFKIGTFGKEPDAFISKELFEEYKSKYSYPKKGDILFSAAGTIGRTVIFDGSPSYFQDSNIVWIDNDETLVLNKYLYYFYSLGNWATSEGGTIARLYNDNISRTPIPVPPLEVQEQIVSILDRFDTLVNDFKSGLPAEIALRRKQYEYYRDKLLTFKPLNDM